MTHKRFPALLLLLGTIVPMLLLGAGSSRADDNGSNGGAVRFLKGIPVPGKMVVFDISWVDQPTQLYYLADRSNAVIDVVNAKTDTFVRQIAGGFKGSPAATTPPAPTASWSSGALDTSFSS